MGKGPLVPAPSKEEYFFIILKKGYSDIRHLTFNVFDYLKDEKRENFFIKDISSPEDVDSDTLKQYGYFYVFKSMVAIQSIEDMKRNKYSILIISQGFIYNEETNQSSLGSFIKLSSEGDKIHFVNYQNAAVDYEGKFPPILKDVAKLSNIFFLKQEGISFCYLNEVKSKEYLINVYECEAKDLQFPLFEEFFNGENLDEMGFDISSARNIFKLLRFEEAVVWFFCREEDDIFIRCSNIDDEYSLKNFFTRRREIGTLKGFHLLSTLPIIIRRGNETVQYDEDYDVSNYGKDWLKEEDLEKVYRIKSLISFVCKN